MNATEIARRDRRRRRREGFRGDENLEGNMTPMIDVCFQLLIFFMVTSEFKTLEGKLSAFMPKVGRDDRPAPLPETLPVRIVLRWNPSIARCKVYVGQVLCNYDDAGIARAFARVRAVREQGATTAEIDAGGDVPMSWVVQAMNMLIRADMAQINFTGAMNPLGDNK